jgi:hypothetical protein
LIWLGGKWSMAKGIELWQ